MGIIVAIGLTTLWPVSIGLASFYLILKRQTLSIPTNLDAKLVYLLSAIIFISSLVAFPFSGSGFYQASAIALSPIIIANWKFRPYWFNVLAGIQLVWIIAEYFSGATRASGISANGSALGISALMALKPTSLLVISLSLSRTALIGFFLFALLRNHRLYYAMFALLFVVHVSIQLWVQPDRLSLHNWEVTIDKRVAAIDGSATELIVIDGEIIFGNNVQNRKLELLGYGYGGYVPNVGRIQPHNIYVLSVWELGILAAPFWTAILILLWRSRNPYLLVPMALAVLVDEWYTLTEGVFFLIVYHQITREIPFGLTFMRRIPIMNRYTLAPGHTNQR